MLTRNSLSSSSFSSHAHFPLFLTLISATILILPVYIKLCTGSVRIHVGTLTDFFLGLGKETVDYWQRDDLTIWRRVFQGVSTSNSADCTFSKITSTENRHRERGWKIPRDQNAFSLCYFLFQTKLFNWMFFPPCNLYSFQVPGFRGTLCKERNANDFRTNAFLNSRMLALLRWFTIMRTCTFYPQRQWIYITHDIRSVAHTLCLHLFSLEIIVSKPFTLFMANHRCHNIETLSFASFKETQLLG